MPLEEVAYLHIEESLELNTINVPTTTLETDHTIFITETSKTNKIHESSENYN